MLYFKCDFCGKGPLKGDGYGKFHEFPPGWKAMQLNINYSGAITTHACDECCTKYKLKERKIEKESIIEAMENLVQQMIDENNG